MPHLPLLEPAAASKDVADVYIDFQRRMGFPAAPNFITAASLERLVANLADLSPAKARAIILFGLECARSPQRLIDADYAVLRGHGLTQSEIMEAIAMAALAVYANTIADATGMRGDDMFARL